MIERMSVIRIIRWEKFPIAHSERMSVISLFAFNLVINHAIEKIASKSFSILLVSLSINIDF